MALAQFLSKQTSSVFLVDHNEQIEHQGGSKKEEYGARQLQLRFVQ